MNYEVGEATEGLENEFWVGKATEGFENELWRRWSDGKRLENELCWLARWIKWRACDVVEAKEGLGMSCDVGKANEGFGEWVVTWVKWREGWRMSSALVRNPKRVIVQWVGIGTHVEGAKILWRYEIIVSNSNQLCSFSNISVTSPTSQFIHQPFRRFTYVTGHSPTLPSLHLRHRSFSNPSVALPTSQVILQPFRRFTYVTVHSTTLLSLLLRLKLFT